MKKLFTIFFLTLLLFLSAASAQTTKYGWLAKNSWSFGFGGTYPRYISTQLGVREEKEGNNYGGFLSIQKNFSEHIGLRLLVNYLHMEGYTGSPSMLVTNEVISGNFDFMYYFIPCEPISPYIAVGLGWVNFSIDNSPTPENNDSFNEYQLNLIFGSEWRLGESWKLKTELGYHTPANSSFDGVSGEGNGLLGGRFDTYGTFDLGVLYFFALGEKSNICELYEGIGREVDYARIEEIIKKYSLQPTEVDYNRIEEIVKKHTMVKVGAEDDNWVLIGVNFDFNKSSLRPESLPILYDAAEVLLINENIKIEIQGHTDDIGSENYNQRLSLQRAESVKNFLVAKGVSANRITTSGLGKSKPIVPNDSSQNRELNRRIEFKVLNK